MAFSQEDLSPSFESSEGFEKITESSPFPLDLTFFRGHINHYFYNHVHGDPSMIEDVDLVSVFFRQNPDFSFEKEIRGEFKAHTFFQERHCLAQGEVKEVITFDEESDISYITLKLYVFSLDCPEE